MKVTILVTRVLAGAALLAAATTPAFAGLGGGAASVAVDRTRLNGQVNITTGAGFTVHEITLPSRTVLREYLSPDGKVFAVSWRGPARPDLSQALGDYYPAFRAAVRGAGRGPDHRHLSVEQSGLVIHARGHMRNHLGLVYIPGLVPQNVSLRDIR